MASFSRKKSILGALVIAAVMVVGAYVVSGSGLGIFSASTVNAQSTQALLAAYAQKDSDADGLPDWEESLYGTDPNNPHSISPTMLDGQAVAQGLIKPKFSTASAQNSTATSTTDVAENIPGVLPAPGSLTDQFAQNLFGQYISQSNGTEPTQEQITTYAQNAVQSLVQNHSTQNAFTPANEHVSGTGNTALMAYAADTQAALAKDAPQLDKNEIDYFSDALANKNSTATASLAALGKSYINDGPRLMQVTVPTEAQYAHLAIANATSRLGEDITDMSYLNTDPLRAYLGLSAYEKDSLSFLQAFSDMGAVFNSESVTVSEGQQGSSFYKAVTTAATKMTAVKAQATSS